LKTNEKKMEQALAVLRGLSKRNLKLRLEQLRNRQSTIQLFCKMDVYSKDGKLVRSSGMMRSRSFVKNFLVMFEYYIAHAYNAVADNTTIVNTAGSSKTHAGATVSLSKALSAEAPSTNDSYGILVGTGTTAPALTDYTIETQIADGSSAGQLQHGACAVSAADINGSYVDLPITRTFTNASGGQIVIKEAGLAFQDLWGLASSESFLVAHDAADQTVDDGEICVVVYTIRVTL
jgi:hypothetical protein